MWNHLRKKYQNKMERNRIIFRTKTQMNKSVMRMTTHMIIRRVYQSLNKILLPTIKCPNTNPNLKINSKNSSRSSLRFNLSLNSSNNLMSNSSNRNTNSSITNKIIHLLTLMCLSLKVSSINIERLRLKIQKIG